MKPFGKTLLIRCSTILGLIATTGCRSLNKQMTLRPLSKQDAKAEFAKHFASVQKQFFKLERRQSYDEGGDPFYRLWRAGKTREAISQWQVSPDFLSEQNHLVKPALAHGVRLIRVRVFNEPLSDYLKYEFETYRASAALGQDIRCVTALAVAPLFSKTDISDFVMFDDRHAMVDNFNELGISLGSFAVENERDLETLAHLRDELIKIAGPCEISDSK